MKLKNSLITFIVLLVIFSCKKDDDNTVPHDPVAQAKTDDEKLVTYLQTHYYKPAAQNEHFGVVDTIMNGETPLMDEVKTQEVTQNDIQYKLYYYMHEKGVGKSPTRFDSVFVKYKGFTLDSVKFDERSSNTWLHFAGGYDFQNRAANSGVIQGWKSGFPNFASGTNVSQPGEPITFENTGIGVLFMPSGLAYGNTGSYSISPNEPLLFHVELSLVEVADYDNDSILNKEEDLDDDGEVVDEDTDKDGIPNFADTDDDNDGVLTKDEVEHKEYIIDLGEQEPDLEENEFEVNRTEQNGIITISTTIITDTNSDGTPDYLDSDTK